MPAGEVAPWDSWADSAKARLREVGVKLGELEAKQERTPGSQPVRLSIFQPTHLSTPGPLVVYMPGRWCNSRLWAVDEPTSDLRVALAVAGYPTITVAYRASEASCGKVTMEDVAAVRTSHLLADVATAVTCATRAMGSRPVVLCGFSMGASLGFLAAADIKVQALVAMDGGLHTGPPQRPELADQSVIANPYRHPRHVRAALARIAAPDTPVTVRDRMRWRLVQDRWWSAAQVGEIRSGLDVEGASLRDRLQAVTCPILCFAADDRDSHDDLRAPRTAALTRARTVRTVQLRNWLHEDVATSPRTRGEDLALRIDEFLRKVCF